MAAGMFDATVLRNQAIPLHDGCKTAADVYLPVSRPGPRDATWPVILERTPYDKDNPDLVRTATRYANQGYAVVLQDVRGRFGSEGAWYKARGEGPDGFDTVEWIAQQPWCDGRVSTMGLSYSTCTQASLAALNPPHLAAQFLSEGIGSYYRAAARRGGALELRQVIYLMRQACTSHEARADVHVRRVLETALEHAREWLYAYPIRRGVSPLQLVPTYERYLVDLETHGEFDDWWRTPGHSPILYTEQYPDIPLCYLGGWFDHHVLMQTQTFTALKRHHTAPLRLVIGPWLHGVTALGMTWAGEVEFGAEARIDYDAFRLDWFNGVIKNQYSDLLQGPAVRFFVMGTGDGHRTDAGRIFHGGYWRTESTWPPEDIDYVSFYLHEAGALSTQGPGEVGSATTYLYDPATPVPSIGGNFGPNDEFVPGGVFDQRGRPGTFFSCTDTLPLAVRSDVLTFRTVPFERDTLVAGPVVAELFVSSDCPDTDFTVKLLDVYPPSPSCPGGLALNLCDDILRARYHDTFEQANFLKPGQVYKLTIELPPTANVFKKGHRLRVDISSSNFPRFDRNPNTGEPQGRQRAWRRALNTVHHSTRHASRLIVPVLDD